MNVKTFRAKTMQDALARVRRELGPDAAVLHTRQCRAGLLGWVTGRHEFEITASTDVNVPSRIPPRSTEPSTPADTATVVPTPHWRPARDTRSLFADEMKGQLNELQSMVEDLCRRTRTGTGRELPPAMFELYTDLIDAEMGEDLAREWIDRVRGVARVDELVDPAALKARLVDLIEAEITVSGPLRITPGKCRLVALVGPTGVGKTTTIAKLAANYRLRDKRKVGLITVDTYRIAAVEQLRTYADIIDLPMKVVSTPREMREAVQSMSHLDLVLLDTAGRSPKDDVKIQELRSFLSEAQADEVHLVLSATAGAGTLRHTAEQFAVVGATSMIVTKLDEAGALGNLLPLIQTSKLPLSYLTDGQNVPDDIAPADAHRLASLVLGLPAEPVR